MSVTLHHGDCLEIMRTLPSWEIYSGGNDFKYCPNCGVKMKGDMQK